MAGNVRPDDLRCPQCHEPTLVMTTPMQLRGYTKARDVCVICTTCEHVYTLEISDIDHRQNK
jgi:rubredoxin